ncbi:DUF2235 domain-containing protein [Chryseobacterium sp. ERMR1:04]|uniref:phospholipase effector Tle1 domain-containing protein n=1 Tax=Chryseobacterium sp. ERMR1:04 TaxID=1705393 RepID=UPI0006C8AC98|nr:DUF2235 domain-containing protein [Chryseobacterium sp. ERMR1:04]KPH14444.1 hypothetical protein AMQ68_02885 [Chryseobacterium sp. ERMR1:04]
MIIHGEKHPLANESYTYTIMGATGKPKVKQWKITDNGKELASNTTGIFTFTPTLAGKILKLIAVVDLYGKDYDYFIELFIQPAKPMILEVYWLDINNEKIVNRAVAYLDTVKLVIRTRNIPMHDKIKVIIYEDEYADGHDEDTSRNMGTYDALVDRKGYARITFNNIQVYQKTLNKMDYVNEDEHEFYARILYSNTIDQVKDKIQLRLKNQLLQMVKPYVGNNPVLVGKPESIAKDAKIGLDFTFGIFIDGTLNNMYNTEIKQKADGKNPPNATGLVFDKNKSLEIYKSRGDEKYRDSSYENDLSNPAILFKNYKADLITIFKIYTEGVGTNSAPEKQGGILEESDYKKDDAAEGPAFGMGSAGIKDKVRKSIKDVIKKIKENTFGKNNVYVSTITFDVFGFSRGAAAARHFVHVVKYPAYPSKTTSVTSELVKTARTKVEDQFGYALSESYAHKTMPSYGYLGQLLKEAGLLGEQTKIDIRFVGIYDTVPHHGLRQKNDAKDLGLNDVNKANYVVHMVAADEHRYNFDLVDISSVAKVSPESGKKGGIELTYPGVHCDVGGAYVEGDGNHPYRIEVDKSKGPLEKLKEKIVSQGWFRKEEMKVDFYTSGIIMAGAFGNYYRLEGNKKYVSNQYSFIPLHIMAEFCRIKEVPINQDALKGFKDFSKSNTIFLENIKKTLWNYSFKGGESMKFIEAEVYKEQAIVYETGSPHANQYKAEWERRQKEGQAKMDAAAEQKNTELKKLRYHYLHWNSTYASPKESIGTFATGKNKPNMVHGKRKRDVH